MAVRLSGPGPLRAGKQHLVLGYKAVGKHKEQGRVMLNNPVAQACADRSVFRYTGSTTRARIAPGPQAPGSMMVIDEATEQSRRQARAVAALQAIKPPQTT